MNCSPVSTTPAINFSLVSLTPLNSLSPVSLTPVINIIREYLREFSKKFKKAPMELGARGTLIHEKNLKSKISCQTPFNPVVYMARGVMILIRATSITRAIGRRWHGKIDTFLGTEMYASGT